MVVSLTPQDVHSVCLLSMFNNPSMIVHDLCPENLVVFRQSGSSSSMLSCSVVSYSL